MFREEFIEDTYEIRALNACRVCLISDVKLDPLINTQFEDIYLILTGIVPHKIDRRPQFLCMECKYRLKQYNQFRNKCLRSDNLLTQILVNQPELTNESLAILDRNAYQLQSNLFCSPVNIISVASDGNEIKEEVDNVKKEELTDIDNFDDFDTIIDSPKFDSEDDIPLTNMKEEPKIMKLKKRKFKVKNEIQERYFKKGFKEDYAEEIILSKEEQLEELKKRSESSNYIHSPYKCTLCYKGFIDSVAYSNHKMKHDKSSGSYECDICHCRYANRRQITSHIATSHSKRYLCKACDHRSHTANQARDHEKWHRGFQYECRLCGWKFRKPTTHLTHMRKRHPTEWTCTICGCSFVGRHGLLMHQAKMHRSYNSDDQKSKETASTLPERYCKECDVLFVSAEAKQRHLVVSLRHTLNNKSSDTCIACGERFPNATELARHTKEHSRMTNPDEAKMTIKREIVKKVTCDTCGGQFATRSKLQVHVKRMHLGLKYNKNVVCEVCGRRCTSNATLRYHQRTHTGERPYACSSCPKKFSDKNQLRIHARTHTDERPYACGLCDKTFRQKPALNRHTRVHTGAKPYECQYCAKTFSQSNSMKLHVRTIHLKMPSKRSKGHAMPAFEEQKPDIQNILTLQQL